jgi:hypothetical protein
VLPKRIAVPAAAFLIAASLQARRRAVNPPSEANTTAVEWLQRHFFAMKARLVEYLVSEKGFTVFAMESLVAESDDINQYILNGTGNPAVLLASLQRHDDEAPRHEHGAHHTRQRAARTIGSPLRH